MSEVILNECKLKAGEHFGIVSPRIHTTSAVFSESVYKTKLTLPEHSHELAFFTLIIKGGYSEKFGSRHYSYTPMTVLWRGAETSHRDSVDANSSQFFFVEIEQSALDKLAQYEKDIPQRLVEQTGALTWLAARLRLEIMSGQNCIPLIAEGITLEMLGQLGRKNAAAAETQAPRWLQRVVERLNEEFTDNISSEDLALEARVHPVHLASVFRRFYRESIGEYVQKRRVSHASKLLLNREIPLADIAYTSGFSDQSHFNRIFKRFTGTTPGAFRTSMNS
jgi:AraC family transcriptional regulator